MSISRGTVARFYAEYGVAGVSSYLSSGQTSAYTVAQGDAAVMYVRWDNGGGATGLQIVDPSGSTWTPRTGSPVEFETVPSGVFFSAYVCTSHNAATNNQVTVNLVGGTSSCLDVTIVPYNSSTGSWSLDETGSTVRSQTYNQSETNPGTITSPTFSTSGAGVISFGISQKNIADVTNACAIVGDTLVEQSGTTSTLWTGERLNQSAGQSNTTVQGSLAGGGDVLAMFSISLVTTAGPAAVYEQEGFRVYKDDGSESGSTPFANQDTTASVPLDTTFRQRVLVNVTNDPPGTQYQLEVKKSTDSVWLAVQQLITGYGSPSITLGTGATGTTSCAPSYPASIVAGMPVFCLATGESSSAAAATMPAGWTLVQSLDAGSGTFGVDTGPRGAWLFRKDTVTGTESGTVTVSMSGTTTNTLYATIFSVSVPANYSFQVSYAKGNDATAGTGVSFTADAALALAPNDLLVVGIGQLVDNSTGSARSFTASGITFGTITAQRDTATTQGNDHRHVILSASVSSGTASVAPTIAYTASNVNTQATAVFMRFRAVPPAQPVVLSASAFIAAGGTDATTARLTPPSGKTTSDFQAGLISDDTNPLPSLNLADGKYTELAWSMVGQGTVAASGETYQFRVTRAGTALDTYSVTPAVTFTASVPTPNITGTSSASPQRSSTLTITGTNFGATQGAGTVTIGGVTQTVTSWSDTSIQVTVSRGTNKYGVSLGLVVTDNAGTPSSSYSLTSILPQTGWSYVDLGTPNTTASNRITATGGGDLASGDQLAYDNVGGLVTVYNDATFDADPSLTSFDVEAWTPGSGWGSIGTQTISSGGSTLTAAAGVSTTSSVTGASQARTTATAAAGASTTSAVGASKFAAQPSAAAGASTSGSLGGAAGTSATVAAAAGVSTAGALQGASGSSTTVSPAAGSSASSSVAGQALAAGTSAAAAGASTASAIQGASQVRVAASLAAGVSTTSSASGTSTTRATPAAAAGVSTASTLVGNWTSTSGSFPVAAAGTSTTSTLQGASSTAASAAPAAGVSTASTSTGVSTASGTVSAAAGASTASTAQGASQVGAAAAPAAGTSTASTLTGDWTSTSGSFPVAASGASTTNAVQGAAQARTTSTPAAGVSTAWAAAGAAQVSGAPAVASGTSTVATLVGAAQIAGVPSAAGGVSTTSTLVGDSITGSAGVPAPAAGASTAGMLASAATKTTTATPAAGSSQASMLQGAWLTENPAPDHLPRLLVRVRYQGISARIRLLEPDEVT